MKQLPASPNLDHLKKQAKELLRGIQHGDPESIQRFAEFLPAARGIAQSNIRSFTFRLHDAQSCLAREYGFASWNDLRDFVELQATERAGLDQFRHNWLVLAYSRGYRSPKPAQAARILAAHPELVGNDPYIACTVGDETVLRRALDADASLANRQGGEFGMQPLIALTHSGFLRLPELDPRMWACANLLLDRGADPNGIWKDPQFPDGRLSVLYGAAGANHNAAMTCLLLSRGADPKDHGNNPHDSEALYHCVESSDVSCLRLLLEAGARVEGTNALAHALDYDRPQALKLLLDHTRNINERDSHALGHAIRRGRSFEQIKMLLDAGADPAAKYKDGLTPYRLALLYGITDVAELIRQRSKNPEPLSESDAFVAACARGDLAGAKKQLARDPNLLRNLSYRQLRLLPDLADACNFEAVKTMVEIGWPIDYPGGDWKASALNLAVFNGHSEMAEFLLAHGADWRSAHGYNDNVMGTLSYASQNVCIARPGTGDWLGCAKALIAHGTPIPSPTSYEFAPEIEDYFASLRP